MIKTFREFTKSCGSLGADSEISIFGTVTGSAPKAKEVIKNMNQIGLKMIILPWHQECSFLHPLYHPYL